MKWEKAIKIIEAALADGQQVEVRYHRKWARNVNELNKYGMVESVTTYNWHGQICKGVSLRYDSLDEGNHIIDEVNVWKEGKA